MGTNILLDKLPTSIKVGGKEYPIHSDFRTAIRFENIMIDSDINDEEKGQIILDLFFDDWSFVNDENSNEVIEKILDFYTCKRDVDIELEEYRKEILADIGTNIEDEQNDCDTNDDKVERIYDFRYDDFYIYAAFLQQYGIDLQDVEYLHWWKFRALLNGLEEGKFCKIIEYRSVKLEDIKDKEQREFYSEMKKIYALPSKEKIKYEELDKA